MTPLDKQIQNVKDQIADLKEGLANLLAQKLIEDARVARERFSLWELRDAHAWLDCEDDCGDYSYIVVPPGTAEIEYIRAYDLSANLDYVDGRKKKPFCPSWGNGATEDEAWASLLRNN